MALDFAWIAGLILSNLHWVFALFAAGFLFYDGKKAIMPFLTIVFLLWAFFDFSAVTGWAFAVAGFIALHYISRVAIMTFCEDVEKLRDILPVIFVLQFLTVFVIFNIFLK